MTKKIKSELMSYITRKGVTDRAACETIAHDVLLDKKANGYELRNAKYRVLKYHDPKRNYKASITGIDRNITVYLHEPISDSEECGNILDNTPADTSNEYRTAKLIEQRQLIRKLLRGSDERTTAIVQTWLSLDQPTFTKVAEMVGSNRKTVQRCISRLSRNYNADEHGSIYDYLSY